MVGKKFKDIANRTEDVRKAIQAALREQGVDPGNTFRDFPQNIRDIKTGGGVPEAPEDGGLYGRKNKDWEGIQAVPNSEIDSLFN